MLVAAVEARLRSSLLQFLQTHSVESLLVYKVFIKLSWAYWDLTVKVLKVENAWKFYYENVLYNINYYKNIKKVSVGEKYNYLLNLNKYST